MFFLLQRKYYQLDSLEAIDYRSYDVQLGSTEFQLSEVTLKFPNRDDPGEREQKSNQPR